MRFTGIVRPEEFRRVTRAHVIAWRDDLARRALDGSTVRNRLAALSSLFEYLCDKNAVAHNPVKGVKRPRAESGEGKTPALGDHQARELLAAPNEDTLKSKRDCPRDWRADLLPLVGQVGGMGVSDAQKLKSLEIDYRLPGLSQ
jgi:site-specific recombinase XerC